MSSSSPLVAPVSNSTSSFVSVFDHQFDVVVFGAGLVGFASAKNLVAQGREVLLVESSGDLLWDATRTLENSRGDEMCSEWREWTRAFYEGGCDAEWVDVALAEIVAAHALRQAGSNWRALLYATPVHVQKSAGAIVSVAVATKSGMRRIRARHWVDATEQGLFARLCDTEIVGREPEAVYRSLVMQSQTPEKLDALAPQLKRRHPELSWLTSIRETERRLRWKVGDEDWHRKVVAIMRDLRALTGDDTDIQFILSHCSMRDFPVYAATSPELQPVLLPENLIVASPMLRTEAIGSPAERFGLGFDCTTNVPRSLEASAIDDFTALEVGTLPQINESFITCDVIVAGAGTAGAVAAISAGRHGARTLSLEPATYPGGIGTGGGINSYFYGAKGGLQDEIDLRTQEMTRLLTGTSGSVNSWHHEARKLVLLEMFGEAGVTFIGDAMVCGVETAADGWVRQVIAVVEGRLVRLPARAFVDSTGDGDLCALAGADFKTGRVGDGRTLAFSQSTFFLRSSERGIHVQGCNFDAGWVDPTDPEDLSNARLTGIAQHLPANWSDADRPLTIAPSLGLRQSRQIDTDIQVALADMVGHSLFSDAIGEVKSCADTHSVDFEFESDELAFYYWTCRAFRHNLWCELPYRMLLPRGLRNLWIACRASGIENDASYGLRMQRELQRLGEIAGHAAALSAVTGLDSREIDVPALQKSYLSGKGDSREHSLEIALEELIRAFERGLPGIHLWHMYRDAPTYRHRIEKYLSSTDTRLSFYAASLLAMWGDPVAEPRLLQAILEREVGPTPAEHPVVGAFGQCIDLPFWLQSVMFLRRVGTWQCLPALRQLAEQPHPLHNVHTSLALTLNALAGRLDQGEAIHQILELLIVNESREVVLPPSRSLWHSLHGLPQKKLGSDRGADTRGEHGWQLHLTIARALLLLGQEIHCEAEKYKNDSRAYVRKAFRKL